MNLARATFCSLLITIIFMQSLALAAASPDLGTPLKDLKLLDPGLAACVQKWADEEMNQYQTVGDVKELQCSRMGIQSLEGIENFQELHAIDLSYNPIANYEPLYKVWQKLGFVWLWDNSVTCEQLAELRKNLKYAWIGGLDAEACK